MSGASDTRVNTYWHGSELTLKPSNSSKSCRHDAMYYILAAVLEAGSLKVQTAFSALPPVGMVFSRHGCMCEGDKGRV